MSCDWEQFNIAHSELNGKYMRYVVIGSAFWVLLTLIVLGTSRPQILLYIEDDLQVITDVPMERNIAHGWKGWI